MERVTITGRFQQVLSYASGTGARTGSTLDMQLWSQIALIAEVHAVGASETVLLKLYEGNASDMSDETAVPGAEISWTAATTPLQIIDHLAVTKRYCRAKITKTPGTNASAESVVGLRYEPKMAVAENNTSGVVSAVRTTAGVGQQAYLDPSY